LALALHDVSFTDEAIPENTAMSSEKINWQTVLKDISLIASVKNSSI